MGNPWENLMYWLTTPANRVWRRVLLLAAALFMLVAFLVIVLIGVVLALVFLIGFLFSGSAWLRDRITKFGQALDSAANVVLLDGHPKETISSHVGRMYSAKFGNPYKAMPVTNPDFVLPWQARIVFAITNFGEADHVYHAVEEWAVDANIEL
jgi:hypothetical protein